MKYILLLLLLPVISRSQVKEIETPTKGLIGQIKIIGDPVARIEWIKSGNDTTYSLSFKDLQFRYINEYRKVEFSNTNGAIDTLYSILLKAFDLPKLGSSRFELGNETLEIVRRKHMGFNGINVILVKNNSSFGLTKKDLDLLFGKTKTE